MSRARARVCARVRAGVEGLLQAEGPAAVLKRGRATSLSRAPSFVVVDATQNVEQQRPPRFLSTAPFQSFLS